MLGNELVPLPFDLYRPRFKAQSSTPSFPTPHLHIVYLQQSAHHHVKTVEHAARLACVNVLLVGLENDVKKV